MPLHYLRLGSCILLLYQLLACQICLVGWTKSSILCFYCLPYFNLTGQVRSDQALEVKKSLPAWSMWVVMHMHAACRTTSERACYKI
ncbi:uncharacterized protein BT62DRAFT_86783 [Guyanagaster necrorhizus]|uniref:Uncharacterized protein n=1 Tax=Guyanagaster necrorhizus TaxID=856835 RepID=A0A9P7VV88_9AGAR|nr:uncharacterized protein BT62DRAFT_86783 [Guyanagaster necrorhizus MCA 3950]KAG7446789.1 hypothetical protein BT62DRAFT_86783 [Guyanagaster necrorhizus MCA 3950]